MNEDLSDVDQSDTEAYNDVFVSEGLNKKNKKAKNKEDISSLFASAEEVILIIFILINF
jgi:hypothetical protein